MTVSERVYRDLSHFFSSAAADRGSLGRFQGYTDTVAQSGEGCGTGALPGHAFAEEDPSPVPDAVAC